MNRGARGAGPPYRSRPSNNRPPGRYRPPPRGRGPPPSTKPRTSKSSAAKKSAKKLPGIIGIVTSILSIGNLLDRIVEKIDPKHYDFEVNDRVIFLEDSEEFDFDRHSVPVYRICKKCDSENTYNLWDVHEKKVVAEEIDGGCLKKVSKH
ncbi:hypothetical protein GTA08_BOTSDO03330 [Botryosphaeria dothidea]|uniref:Uncharacterized protein n=1 Tax=Botryosphaeria dothidea TaxID=55169 RepID=A0A8H4IZD7_9PEZI|nr:hypothetical protein GTA08_BOTSDO03330 [Botryosphaeria dothidea]